MRDIVHLALRLLLFTLVAGLLLGGTYVITKGPIETQAAEQLAASQRELFGSAESFSEVTVGDAYPGVLAVYAANVGDTPLGWVISVTSNGYKGAILQSVGVGTNGRIVGSVVTAQGETAGLGSKVAQLEFLKQFINQPADPDMLTLDAITGATISSKAVFTGIKSAAEYAKNALELTPNDEEISQQSLKDSGVVVSLNQDGAIIGVVEAKSGSAVAYATTQGGGAR